MKNDYVKNSYLTVFIRSKWRNAAREYLKSQGFWVQETPNVGTSLITEAREDVHWIIGGLSEALPDEAQFVALVSINSAHISVAQSSITLKFAGDYKGICYDYISAPYNTMRWNKVINAYAGSVVHQPVVPLADVWLADTCSGEDEFLQEGVLFYGAWNIMLDNVRHDKDTPIE